MRGNGNDVPTFRLCFRLLRGLPLIRTVELPLSIVCVYFPTIHSVLAMLCRQIICEIQ